jgi:hypothetical protein
MHAPALSELWVHGEPCATGSQNPTDKGSGSPTPNDALSGRGPIRHQETRWPVPAVRLNA